MADVRIVDSSNNPIDSDDLTNGRGLRVVNLAVSAVRGVHGMGDSVATGKPVFIGGFGSTGLAATTPVIEAELVPWKFTADGRAITLPYTIPEDVIQTETVTLANDASAHELIAAVTGYKIAFLGGIVCTLSTTVVSMTIIDGGTAAVLARIPLVNTPVLLPLPKVTNTSSVINYQLSAGVGANTAYFTPIAYKTKLG